jgi:hypothetical protein
MTPPLGTTLSGGDSMPLTRLNENFIPDLD